MKRKGKLKYHLILSYLAIILIPLIALGSIAFYISLSIVRDQTVEQDRNYLHQISNNIDTVVNHMQSTSLIAYSSTTLQQYIVNEDIDSLEIYGDINIHNYLYSLKSADFDNYTYILKTYANDIIYCNNYDYIIDRDYDFDQLHWIESVKAGNGSTVFVPTYIPTYYLKNQSPVFSIARQINDNYSLIPLGYMIINCDIDLIDSIIGVDTGHLIVFDAKGQMVYPYGVDDLNIQVSYSDDLVQKIDGERYLVSNFTSATTGLQYYKFTPYDAISQTSNLIIQMTIITIILTLLISLLFSFPLSKYISRPINQLIRNMDNVNREQFQNSVVTTNILEIDILNKRYNSMMRRIDNHIQQEYLAKIRQKDIEFKLLQSQISPHFLFNTLESIRMMAALNDDPESAEMIYNLANLYRYSIRITNTLVPLKSEISHIDHYLALQKMRFGDKFNYKKHIDPATDNMIVPQLILQPLIENSLVHGFASIDCGGLIELITRREKHHLTITIKDNGHGIKPEALKDLQNNFKSSNNQGHIGLPATYERIKHHFPESDIFIDSTEEKGTSITITITYSDTQS